MHRVILVVAIGLAAALIPFAGIAQADDLKIGIIGTDTSHVGAFTELINNPDNPKHVPGGKVIAAFKGGSPDVESSITRVDKYAEEIQTKYGVKIVDSIEELCTMVDAVLLESVDGRPHLEQARPVFAAKKIIYIDKPIAGTLKDAIEIFRLSKESGIPTFSSSSYRYYPSMQEVLGKDVGAVRGALSYGPATHEEHHPGLFWYGVHATEALFTVMKTGCETVVRTETPEFDVVTGTWSGGRIGTLIGLRTKATPHQVTIFGDKAVAQQQENPDDSYAPLVVEIMKFFKTKVAPITPQETIEMFAFMEAADESKRQGGAPVKIEDVLKKALDGKPLPY
ncbi:MAG: Gfo/Idh/MocA family oxidoreductase [Candidatus Hydrogenedentes bacterium]|nr:Gfo/Idh/MocA family oxidoreductase [Candidatus Hydrogenedentota bacterium]